MTSTGKRLVEHMDRQPGGGHDRRRPRGRSALRGGGHCSEARRRAPWTSASPVGHRSGRPSTWGTSCRAGSRRSSATGRR
eukprot:scaffold2470_cov340-Prasinococcus_capsulatus_cf.AAC.3